MLYAVIVGCEVLFWVLVVAGLVARYALHRARLGAALLLATPLVDLALLVVAVADLRRGGTASTGHALAAVYVGVSVGFGRTMVRRADERVAHRLAGAPAPRPRPRYGQAHAAHERRMLLRHLVAYVVGAALLGVAVLMAGDPNRSGPFLHTLGLWSVVLVIDAAVSLSYTVRPRPDPVGPRR
ncbi:hypothetical protein JQN72_15655 [Phycicoccus sp. CSK15P-2]|uniref:hypothetical protein n=1 Tax=Phycicoccus sp. CSK15P-2 TaxID=2807627 RepID=UPI0019513080|nr:hypothetical protein [Phycicoccus sp. CSK15P-2]MBM6405677.1 hypothetical protein [Phycicoccus sp. CSK15P-2]